MIVDTDAKLRADGLTEKQITARLQSNTHTAFMTRLTTQLSAHAIGLGFRSKRADPNARANAKAAAGGIPTCVAEHCPVHNPDVKRACMCAHCKGEKATRYRCPTCDVYLLYVCIPSLHQRTVDGCQRNCYYHEARAQRAVPLARDSSDESEGEEGSEDESSDESSESSLLSLSSVFTYITELSYLYNT